MPCLDAWILSDLNSTQARGEGGAGEDTLRI